MPAFSEAEIRAAIRASLASALSVAESTLDDDRDFDAYGLPSLEAVELAGELEDFLGREIDAEAIFDHPSVAQLARHLASAA
ncbi:MAG: acyl carrier protein [Hyphomonadaceae bacterium]|nr:acyl carrier protein [Hyphomonadaceae bacterium]